MILRPDAWVMPVPGIELKNIYSYKKEKKKREDRISIEKTTNS
jgi:hypothetical protein